MADFSALIQRIKDAVYENGVQAITGQILQDCLKDVVNTVNVAKQDGIYRITVTVDPTTGTPSGSARMDEDTYTLELSFSGLKGETGQQGPQGPKGDTGETGPAGVSSAQVSVDPTTGTPSATASVSDGVLTIHFSGLKGETGPQGIQGVQGPKGDTGDTGATGPQGPQGVQGPQGIQGPQGNTGSSVDYPYELVNNLTTDDATKGLSAAQGVVLESEVSQLRPKVTGYFYNENVSVNTNSQRFKNYTLDPGSKIVVRVSLVSGTSATINLYWIKTGGNVAILSGYPIGYMTDILTVPDDATGIQIFMTPAASGNVNKIEIWDATKAEYLTEKIGQFGLDFLNNRKMISKTVTIPANNPAMDLVSLNEGRLAGLSGDIYAYISCSPKIADDKEIQFWNTEDSSSRSVGIYGIEMRQDRVFKIWHNKTFSRIVVDANVVTTSTEVTIVVFAIVPSDTYLKYPLYGKKVMCFGDSITEFKTSIDNKRYTDHLQEYSQADVKNAGIGGTRLAQRLTPSLTPTDNQYCVAAFDICNMVIAWATGDYSLQDAALASGLLTSEQQSLYESKIAMLKDNPIAGFDIVTIMAGANDYRGGSPVGLENQETMDKGTIRGAINAMISALLAAKPTIEINFFSPLILMMGGQVSLNNSSDVYIPSLAPDGMSFPAYIEKIHDAVKENHCPFNDMYWSLGFNVYNFTTFFGNDLSHPYRGFRVIAERMYKYLLQR